MLRVKPEVAELASARGVPAPKPGHPGLVLGRCAEAPPVPVPVELLRRSWVGTAVA